MKELCIPKQLIDEYKFTIDAIQICSILYYRKDVGTLQKGLAMLKTSDILSEIKDRVSVARKNGSTQSNAYDSLLHPESKDDVKPRSIRLSGDAMAQFRVAGERLGFISSAKSSVGMSEAVEQIALCLPVIIDALETVSVDDMPIGLLKSGMDERTAKLLYRALVIIHQSANQSD